MTSETEGPEQQAAHVQPTERSEPAAAPRYDFDKVADALADISASPQKPQTVQSRSTTESNSLWSIPLDVDVVLGHARLPVSELMNLAIGDTLSLDRRIGDPVEIIANGTTIAWGQLCAVDESGERFGVRLTKLSGAAKAAPSARRPLPEDNREPTEAETESSDMSDQRVA